MREHKGRNIVALPSDYVAIDVETTGLDYSLYDIIEVSAVKYSGGTCIDKFSSLVRPQLVRCFYPFRNNGEGEWTDGYIDSHITELTGITNEMLESAPLPAEVIPKFLEFIGDSILIGHNANFDINFLYDAAESECGIHLSNDFIDTLRIARKVFPRLEHHRLGDVATACGIYQVWAHRAEADALLTAACYEYMRQHILNDQSEEDFINLFTRSYRQTLNGITAKTNEIDTTNPIYGKVVVFTGALSCMDRRSAFQVVANLGGIPQDSVTKKTNYLVIGNTDIARSVKEGKTSKMKKAEAYQQKGEEILVLSECAFFDLISDYM